MIMPNIYICDVLRINPVQLEGRFYILSSSLVPSVPYPLPIMPKIVLNMNHAETIKSLHT